MGEEEPLRIKGGLTRETEKEFIKAEIGNEDDFYPLARKTGSQANIQLHRRNRRYFHHRSRKK